MYICSTACSSSRNTITETTMRKADLAIVNQAVDDYMHDLLPARSCVLQEMEAFAEQEDFPIVGPLVGRLLFMLSASIKAKRILELGSGYGYSAFWFALATQTNARIICTDGKQANKKLAERFLKRGKLWNKIDFRVGEALDVLEKSRGMFDIIFNDIGKQDYPSALRMAIPKLRKGGLFICDNVLWKGRVISKSPDQVTNTIQEFNRQLYSSKELFTTIIPLRDGVSVSIKQ